MAREKEREKRCLKFGITWICRWKGHAVSKKKLKELNSKIKSVEVNNFQSQRKSLMDILSENASQLWVKIKYIFLRLFHRNIQCQETVEQDRSGYMMKAWVQIPALPSTYKWPQECHQLFTFLICKNVKGMNCIISYLSGGGCLLLKVFAFLKEGNA